MLQFSKFFKQDKKIATTYGLDNFEPPTKAVGTIRKPDFLGGQKWEEKVL